MIGFWTRKRGKMEKKKKPQMASGIESVGRHDRKIDSIMVV